MDGADFVVLPVEDGEVVPWVKALSPFQPNEEQYLRPATYESKERDYWLGAEGQWGTTVRWWTNAVRRMPQLAWVPLIESFGETRFARMERLIDVTRKSDHIGGELLFAVSGDIDEEEYAILAKRIESLGREASPFTATSEPNAAPDTEAVPLHTDDPASVDRLGRAAFAEAVANHVRRILDRAATSRWGPENESVGSLAIHLDGPWGSGKSSLLRLMAGQLRRPPIKAEEPGHRPSWIVVEYNAWERQKEDPRWWGLLDTIYTDARKQLVREQNRSALGLRLGELWRRYVRGRKFLWTALLAGATTAGAGIWALISKGANEKELAAVAGGSTLIGTLYAMFKSIKKSVFKSSAEGAKRFAAAQSDPANEIRAHFENLYDSLKSPLAIFLDDMDRCEPESVVELLEGIQTLFRSRPVLFVAAGDRRWISKCFQMHYKDFAELIPNPGHRLGDLFLEKVFQLSVRVPRISRAAHHRFLGHLLHASGDLPLEQQEAEAKALFEDADTEEEVQSRYEEGRERGLRMDLVGQYAARRSSEAEVQERTEHALQRWSHLFERNPRAMKRLLNYYSISRATLYIEGISEAEVTQEDLVRWLAAETRWPLLADALRVDAQIVETIREGDLKKADFSQLEAHFDNKKIDVIKRLMRDADVQQQVGPLTADVVELCAGRLDPEGEE